MQPNETNSRIPLTVKLLYTAFVAVLVPYYWHAYGPTNFLYFCDVALLMALGAVWLERPLLASTPAVGILLPQLLWQADFLGGLFGLRLVGMTEYMFDERLSLLTRGLSFFHFWLPIVLIWLVWRLGYDRRALFLWTVTAWGLILASYLWLPAPPAPPENPNLPVNVNFVHGLSGAAPQTWMHPHLYVAALMIALPLLVFLPTHLVLARLFAPAPPAR